MKITRIFQVQIDSNLRVEFENSFERISMHTVKSANGFISAKIYKPSKWKPDEYAMISEWENETALEAFAGENWKNPVIPNGMEKFVVKCWVHHYKSW